MTETFTFDVVACVCFIFTAENYIVAEMICFKYYAVAFS